MELWDEVIALDRGKVWQSLLARGYAHILLGEWEAGVQDLTQALPFLREQRGGKRAVLPNGDTVPLEAVQEALALGAHTRSRTNDIQPTDTTSSRFDYYWCRCTCAPAISVDSVGRAFAI